MPNVIFIPSSSGRSDQNFYQSTSQKLQENGFKPLVLNIPNPELYQSWKEILEKNISLINEESFIIAHSSGGLAALRFLSENDLRIKSLNLIATGLDENKINSENREFVSKQVKSFKYNQENKLAIDFEKINKNCEFINLHYSEDDTIVDFEIWKEFKKVLPDSVLIKYKTEGHFKKPEIKRLTDFIIFQEKNSWTEVDNKKFRVRLLKNKELPLVLPDVKDYNPNSDGQSPLAKSNWIEIKNEEGKAIGRHESDTMPNWAGSSWYYLRYTDPKDTLQFAAKENLDYWLPVDHYFGGNEHTTLHLLYSRFWHRFLHDQGYLSAPEPYQKRTNGGILLAPDNTKMSKSKGNVINPKDVLDQMGADALRIYIAFIGPYDATVAWQEGGLKACKKLVDNIFKLSRKVKKPDSFKLPKKKTKYLIFDFDGVLGDTQEIFRLATKEIFNLNDKESIEYQQGYTDKPRHSRRNSAQEIQKFTENAQLFFQTAKKYSQEIKTGLFQDFIQEIKKIKNAKLAIVSSGSKEVILPMLEKTDLEFDYIYDFYDSHSKEEKVEKICKDWEISDKTPFYFTDTKSDVLELKTFMNQQKIIGCSWGYQGHKKLSQVLPENQILDEFSEIHRVLKRDDFYSFNGLEPHESENIDPNLLITYHKFVKSITIEIENLRNNVAVAQIMTFVNTIKDYNEIPASIWSGFLKAIAPFAVFTSEELWYKLYDLNPEENPEYSIHLASYPKFDKSKTVDLEVTLAIQVNGKVRGEIKIEKDSSDEIVLDLAKKEVAKYLENKEIKFSKIIPNKIVTLAVK
jgi:leucyl-tRNA synthetase